MMPRLHWVALYLYTLLQLSGCSSWLPGNAREPELTLVKVQVVKAHLLEQRFILHFRIDNPDDDNVAVRSLTYRVYLGDLLLADGTSDQWFTLDAHHTGDFEVPVRTNLWEHLRGLVKLMRHPDRPVPYRLEGELQTGFLYAHTLQLARSGEIIPANFIAEKHR
ncbi:LEA type 2 family protein [Pseudomonas sp. dw_358]|uniref:LEA type 2 family protein n=1 Tax=Pseudomonas sp. dw_358 TaxID=2720083 RepID=UPI001BD1FEE2|nr:LEA type 2 family protein [Pseudomonas sp. dw_358]